MVQLCILFLTVPDNGDQGSTETDMKRIITSCSVMHSPVLSMMDLTWSTQSWMFLI